MIAQLRGSIVSADGGSVVIDVAGVGYAVTVSGRTQGRLGTDGAAVTLLTEMQVREDSMTLFGFVDAVERDAFRLLITVQGVGAKAAMAILSVLTSTSSPPRSWPRPGDGERADGVGPKLAQPCQRTCRGSARCRRRRDAGRRRPAAMTGPAGRDVGACQSGVLAREAHAALRGRGPAVMTATFPG